jgi:dTDP-D-glucose 4,6-dehydratase
MERYYKRKAQEAIDANRILSPDEINWDEEINYDPGLRKEIDSYHLNLRRPILLS